LADGATVSVGVPIVWAGQGIDPEDGALPASAFTWEAARVGQPFQPLAEGVTSGLAVVPIPGTFILRLTVEDSEGPTGSDSVTITAVP